LKGVFMKKIYLTGYLTKNPEISIKGDVKYARFSVAHNARTKSGEEKTEFFECVAFRAKSEFAEKYLSKGSFVFIEGEPVLSKFEKEGRSFQSFSIIVNNFHLVRSSQKKEEKPSEEVLKDFDSEEELPF